MPKRGAPCDLVDMKVEKVDCVTLGGSHPPVPIPQVTERGVTCVPLNSAADWLVRIVSTGCREDAQLVIKEFIDGLLALPVGDAEPGQEAQERSCEAAASADAPKAKGREAMCLDDDSEEEEVNAIKGGARAPTTKPTRKVAAAQKEMRKSAYRGMELTWKPRAKCRGIAVPLEGPTLIAIMRHLREQISKGPIPGPNEAKRERRTEVVSNRDDEDAGRTRWRAQPDSPWLSPLELLLFFVACLLRPRNR